MIAYTDMMYAYMIYIQINSMQNIPQKLKYFVIIKEDIPVQIVAQNPSFRKRKDQSNQHRVP